MEILNFSIFQFSGFQLIFLFFIGLSGSMNTLNLIVAIKILISENIKTWYFEKYKNKKSNQQKSQWQYFQILKTKFSSFNPLISLLNLIVFNLRY